MKYTLLALLALLALTLQASAITLLWDDDNPPGFVAKYTLYQKSGTIWIKVKEIPAGTLSVVVNVTQPTVFSMTTTDSKGIESATRVELYLPGPGPVSNLRAQ